MLGSRASQLTAQAHRRPPPTAATSGARLPQLQQWRQRPCLLPPQRQSHTAGSGSNSGARLGRRRLAPRAALPEALAALQASPARDVAASLFAACGSVALIKFFDTLEGAGVVDQVR